MPAEPGPVLRGLPEQRRRRRMHEGLSLAVIVLVLMNLLGMYLPDDAWRTAVVLVAGAGMLIVVPLQLREFRRARAAGALPPQVPSDVRGVTRFSGIRAVFGR
ncbi:hypothetical protein IQ251_18895 [Saccharopolyspora sp. HNM0983]|uniref:Uncharacterized protein n=1 Tax=Saccharopolyspora montiporae TaxID=2781240 RepID=A0A929G349_9PSEU|nr:hypothetical protein [Saccharopolyspora sp. HNM0983]MBE9376523.1 hypothetical protein [Saccharopolyspora sp. HNM0983]